MKDPKTFEQKYKTMLGRILSYTPRTAWVQAKGKQPRFSRNSCFAFVPNPLIYGPCLPQHSVIMWHINPLGEWDFVEYRKPKCTATSPSSRWTRQDFQGKRIRKEQQTSPTKLKATGKRTGADRHQEHRLEEWNSSRKRYRKIVPHHCHQTIRDLLLQKLYRHHQRE